MSGMLTGVAGVIAPVGTAAPARVVGSVVVAGLFGGWLIGECSGEVCGPLEGVESAIGSVLSMARGEGLGCWVRLRRAGGHEAMSVADSSGLRCVAGSLLVCLGIDDVGI